MMFLLLFTDGLSSVRPDHQDAQHTDHDKTPEEQGGTERERGYEGTEESNKHTQREPLKIFKEHLTPVIPKETPKETPKFPQGGIKISLPKTLKNQ